ncbi:MAG: amidohydrolase family protein [Bdellovibrionaceae bacterium]|nr:amidohydrolase family protein [Pseudobdellovibrionaceae bacterium]
MGPHAIYTVDRPMFEELIAYASDNSFTVHMHLSETARKRCAGACVRITRRRRSIAILGLFNVKTVCAHGTCLSPSDIALLAKKNVGIIHNPNPI